MIHKCHAIGCETPCKPEYLMCPRHWKMLPKPRQRSVLREYRNGQCQLDPIPSPQWHDAADAAIYWIRIAEDKKEVERLQRENEELNKILSDIADESVSRLEEIARLEAMLDRLASTDFMITTCEDISRAWIVEFHKRCKYAASHRNREDA